MLSDRLSSAPVAFDLYTGTVAAESLPTIDAIARRLVVCPDVTLEIEVHTDAFRMSEFNARQSQRVAEAIRDRLVTDGVSASRLAACGYGESRSISTAPGAHNARVEWHRTAMPFSCPTLPP